MFNFPHFSEFLYSQFISSFALKFIFASAQSTQIIL